MAKKKGNKTPKRRLKGVDNVVDRLMEMPYVKKVTTGEYERLNGHIPAGSLLHKKTAGSYAGIPLVYAADKRLGQRINVFPESGYGSEALDSIASMYFYRN